ncbi:MAG: pyridoxal-dependent decarboxylase [Acidobacteriota bacterium]
MDHLSPEEFRRRGHEVVDWIASYLEKVESLPVLSQAQPGDLRRRLPERPPESGESFDAVMRDLDALIVPGITHWQSPNFFAYFPTNGSPTSILGELLSAGLGVQGMLWATSPACTELETHMMDWLVDLLGLPEKYLSTGAGGGVIQDSASSATLCALLAARERATGGRSNAAGCDGRLVAYASDQVHSSIEKACMIAGIGRDQLRKIEVDDAFALSPGALERQMAADRAAGLVPFFVCAAVGSTSSMAIDPVREIARACAEYGAWLHVDAAMAGTAALCPEFRESLHDGVELAESYTFNPHKWMFTNFDCNALFVDDRQALVSALSILPEYLRNSATGTGEVIDYRDWQIPLGRRFRALKLWMVIRHYGREGLQRHVREHVELARRMAEWVEGSEHFELVAPRQLSLVCFRHVAGDGLTERLMHELNAEGSIYLTHTKLNGAFTLRLSIAQWQTRESHVRRAWGLLESKAAELAALV